MNRRPDSTPRPPDEQAQVCENVNTLADQFNSTRIHRTGLKDYQADRSEESLKIGEIRSLEELRNLQLDARRLGKFPRRSFTRSQEIHPKEILETSSGSQKKIIHTPRWMKRVEILLQLSSARKLRLSGAIQPGPCPAVLDVGAKI